MLGAQSLMTDDVQAGRLNFRVGRYVIIATRTLSLGGNESVSSGIDDISYKRPTTFKAVIIPQRCTRNQF